MDYSGNVGSASVQKGFTYAQGDSKGNQMLQSSAALKTKASI